MANLSAATSMVTVTTTTTTDYDGALYEVSSSPVESVGNASRVLGYEDATAKATVILTDYEDDDTPVDLLGNVTGALDLASLGVGVAWSGREEVAAVHLVSYEVVLPLMVLLGVLVNTLGLSLLQRRKLKTRPANRYYVLLLASDLVILVVSLPTAITLNGCRLFNYGVALYFAHLFYTIFYVMQTFTLYIILWISYDRFLALWNFKRFHEVQRHRVLRNRLVFTSLLCVGVHLKHLFQVKVTCWVDGTGVREVSGNNEILDSDTNSSNNSEELSQSCENGEWVIIDDLHYTKREDVWLLILWVLRGLVALVVPILLVLGFNAGIVAGLVHRRLHNPAANPRTRGQAYSSIYIALCISATFIVCTVPTTVYGTFFAKINDCHGPYSVEVFRAIANLLLIVEHLSHFLILSFNETFRIELKTFHTTARRSIVSAFRSCCDLLPGCQRLLSRKTATNTPHPAYSSGLSPQLFIVPPTEDANEAVIQDPAEGPPSSSIPLQFLALTGPAPLPHTTDPSSTRSSLTLPEELDPPSRTSMATIEEVI